MIMRDEEHVIKRCLSSFRDGLSAISMVDTGSLDNSISIVEDFIKENNIQGGVRSREWKDFDRSRNDALEYSFEVIRKSEGLPETGPITKNQYDEYKRHEKPWYIFIIDADDIFYSDKYKGGIVEENLDWVSENHPSNISQCLKETGSLKDEYRIWTRSGNHAFYFSRLFKINPSGSNMPRWHYPVHEVCYVTGWYGATSENLKGGHLYSGRTGGRSKRGNKYKSLNEYTTFQTALDTGRIMPSCIPRILYYMGQCCHDLQFYDQAMYFYNERIKRKHYGNDGEAYVAHMRIQEDYQWCRSALYKELSPDQLMFCRLKHLWGAFNIAPHRREACYELGRYHHDRQEFVNAWFYFKSGLTYDQPLQQDIIADITLYGYKYLQTAYLAAYYAGDKDSFIKYGKAIAQDETAPQNIRDSARNNLLEFAKVKV
jgi:hypothetical protein